MLIMPQFSEFENHFKQMYKVQDDNKILEKAMDKLCWDCYEYINNQLPWGLQAWYPGEQ